MLSSIRMLPVSTESLGGDFLSPRPPAPGTALSARLCQLSARSLSPIRVSPGGRYFETTDGEPFLFIGPNDAITWPGLAGLYRRRHLDEVDVYLESLARHGVTVLRLMLEYVHREHRYFERPVGRFNPALVQLWDDLFARCEEYGLRVLLTPWDNFWMARRWHRHPYSAEQGGPAAASGRFLTDPAVEEAIKNRLRFVVERWGGSGVIAAWDLFNEIHPYWGGSPPQQAEVITRLSTAVREVEEAIWGFSRPQTVSLFGPCPSPEYEELIFRHPCLDFATTHIYEGAIDHPRETITPAVTMGQWVRYALERVPRGRPFLDSEHGPIHLFNDHRRSLPAAFDNEYERHLMWAHLASGGAGSGMRWPARHPHLLTLGMRQALRSLATFTRHLDWRSFTPHDGRPQLRLEVEQIIPFASCDERQALVWLLRDSRKQDGALRSSRECSRLTLCGMAPGAYAVVLWNTVEGCPVGCTTTGVGNQRELVVTLPEIDNDLALAVRPYAG